jgi:hypothetical protein
MNTLEYPNTDQVPRRANGTILPGHSLNPNGKPAGCVGGRAKALAMLDAIVGEEEVQTAIGAAIRTEALENPLRFFKQILMPLFPSEIKMKVGEEGPVTWVSLLTTLPKKEPAPKLAP